MIQQRYKAGLEAIRRCVEELYGERLVTLAVFGSVGRGAGGPDSDIDLLIIARRLPWGRIARMTEFRRVEERLGEAGDPSVVELSRRLSPVIKTPEEARSGSPLFLDMLEDAYSDVVREAQEIVELALKGMLRQVGVEPPKWHDVGSLILEHRRRWPDEVAAQCDELAETSRWLRKEREFSFYGEIDFIPSEQYGRAEAERAASEAREVVAAARLVIDPAGRLTAGAGSKAVSAEEVSEGNRESSADGTGNSS